MQWKCHRQRNLWPGTALVSEGLRISSQKTGVPGREKRPGTPARNARTRCQNFFFAARNSPAASTSPERTSSVRTLPLPGLPFSGTPPGSGAAGVRPLPALPADVSGGVNPPGSSPGISPDAPPGPLCPSRPPGAPPPLPMEPMAESCRSPVSTARSSPASWRLTASPRRETKRERASTPASNSSAVQNLVGSFSTQGRISAAVSLIAHIWKRRKRGGRGW